MEMKDKYLVINAGSSSLKFSLYEMPGEMEIVNGIFERIGKDSGEYTLKYNGKKIKKEACFKSHTDAVNVMLSELMNYNFVGSIDEIVGVGHRILHGGEYYSESVIIDDNVLKDIYELKKLGPLHHPGEIAGILSMREALPNVSQVAVFDTAFHQTIPVENYLYAVPYDWYSKYGVRKYGFHGTSHKYITSKMQEIFNKEDVNLIICHLGSGASISCIKNGKCYDTSMGLTPLDGLVMGTRSGSIDPSIISYVSREKNISLDEVMSELNNKSGLLGISSYNDYRDVENSASDGNEKAILAIEKFKRSIVSFISYYYVEHLEGKLDALVFTGGIGENVVSLREAVVSDITCFGVDIDKENNKLIGKNNKYNTGIISTDDSKFEVWVVPTNEEVMILRDTYNLVNNMDKGLSLVRK